MSVTPIEKPTTRSPQVLDRPRIQTRRAPQVQPKTLPKTHVQVRVRVLERRRTNAAGAWALRGALFVTLFTGTYVGRTIVGQVHVEQARRMELAAKERAIAARRAEAEIRARVDTLTSATTVQQWASTRGYVAPDKQVDKKPKA